MNEQRLQQLRRMTEHRPEDPFLWHAMGLEYARGGQYMEAVTCYEMALSKDVNHVGTYFHLGKSLEALNEWQRALSAYETGIQVARQQGDHHSLSELQQVYEMLKEEREDA